MHLALLQGSRVRARATLLGASVIVLGACGDDAKSGDEGVGTGGAGARFTASGLVLAVDNDAPLARVTVAAPDGARTTTDARGRYSISAREADPIALSASGLAPVTKRAVRAPAVARMKAFDATATISPAAGGLVRSASVHAAARLSAGALTGSDDVEVVLAAIDPRRRVNLSAITGDYTARRATVTGRVSIASPLYVSTADPRRATLSPGAQVELEFPAWVQGLAPRAALFAYEERSADWVEIGPVSAAVDEAGAPVYRASASQLGWLAVGEFVGELACIRGCVNDAQAAPVTSARVSASGVDDFSEAIGATDARGCFTLSVRASATVALEVTTDDEIVHQQTVQTEAGSECQDLGALGPSESQVPPGTGLQAVVERMVGCGLTGRSGLTRALESELGFMHHEADGLVYPAPMKERYAGFFARYVDCLLQAPCDELGGLYCTTGDQDSDDEDDGSQPILRACTAPIDAELEAYDEAQRFRCLDGRILAYSEDTCDGNADCQDGSDETNAACLSTDHFACGAIVGPRSWRCDGEVQCPGGVDEADCFVCDGNDRVRPGHRCDGWVYCDDRTDELDCSDGIVCPLGTSLDSATAAPIGTRPGEQRSLGRWLRRARSPRPR